MNYKACIIRNSDGVERLCDMGPDIHWNESSSYWWEDGNFACDCNRHLTFERAGEPSPTEDALMNEDLPCGRTLYTVPYVLLEDGSRIEINTRMD